MINRASGALFVAYSLVILSGIFFLLTPSLVLAEATDYGELVLVWGMFYLLGGLTSASSLLARAWMRNSVPLWYFETAGIALIVTANLVYAYALARTGFYYQEYNIIALAFVLAAYSAGLVARCVETLRFVRILTGVATRAKG